MTRDHSTSSSSQRVMNKPTSNQQQHYHHHHHHHQTKVIQFKPFYLFSHDDRSLKQAVELVESAALNRFRVCVVSIIGKDSLDESVKDYLIQSLFAGGANGNISNSNNIKRRQKNKNQKSQTEPKTSEDQSSRDCPTTTNLTNDSEDLPLENYENQVVGRVDSGHGVIILNLTSFLETEKLCSLEQIIDGLNDEHQQEVQPILSDAWPKWNQNLIKTMLILLVLSHVVVFYNPEPSIDYSLIQIFKILEALRLKSQTRITDVLETIASKQMFPSQWIRQGRVSCPRALFVCDTTYLDVPMLQNDVLSLKRDLEDQIYKLLKKTDIVPGTLNSLNSAPLFCLPERDDFVFIVTRQDLQHGYNTSRFDRAGVEAIKKTTKEDLFAELLGSLEISKTSTKIDVEDFLDDSQPADVAQVPGVTEECQSESQPSSAKANYPLHNRFRKFLHKHISNIQATAQSDLDNKHHHGPIRQVNSLLPRYDDFFTVLSCMKNLFFPQPDCTEEEGTPGAEMSRQTTRKPNCWSEPDERRFVDIYDMMNTDELFSELHCYKTRLAAFDFYLRDFQTTCPTLAVHENSQEAARKLYLNHARGSACLGQLNQLSEQCQRHWQSLSHSKHHGDDFKKRLFKGSNVSRPSSSAVGAKSSVLRSDSISPNEQATNTKCKSNLTILRRGNGIKMSTCCDCGRRSNYMITPIDRKKKLDRVDIHQVND